MNAYLSKKCSNCGSLEHTYENCPHGIGPFSSQKCSNCGSLEHTYENCPHGIGPFSSQKCSNCGSLEHTYENCPHGIGPFSSQKCSNCGSLEHTYENCPHGIGPFSSKKCSNCGSLEHTYENCPHRRFGRSTSSRNKTTNSNAFNSGRNFGGRLVGGFFDNFLLSSFVGVGIFLVGFLPLVLLYSLLESSRNKFLLFIIAPIKAIKKHFILAYILNSLFWVYLFTTDFFVTDGYSFFWSCIFGILHPLFGILAVLWFTFVFFVYLLKWITGDIYGQTFSSALYPAFLFLMMLNIPYYLFGIGFVGVKYLWSIYRKKQIV